MSSRDRFLAYLAFGLVSFVWGTTYLAIAVAIETLPTFLFPGVRFLLAGLILLAICRAAGQSLPSSRQDWWSLALIGFLMVAVGNVAVVFAEHYVASGFAALLVATAPFWMALIESLRRQGERVTRRKVAGMVVGFAGVGVLVAPQITGGQAGGRFLLGVIVILLSVIAWNLGSIRSKYHLSPGLSPLVAAALQMIFGGLAAGAIGLALGETSLHFNGRTLAAFLYLTIFGSVVAYTAYVYALSKLPTSTVSLHTYINPLVAVFLGWLILREPVGWNAIAAMLAIFAGVAIVQMGRPRVVPQTPTGIVKEVEAA